MTGDFIDKIVNGEITLEEVIDYRESGQFIIAGKTILPNVSITTAQCDGYNKGKWLTFVFSTHHSTFAEKQMKETLDRPTPKEITIIGAADTLEEAIKTHRETIMYGLAELDDDSFMDLFSLLDKCEEYDYIYFKSDKYRDWR
ncbi:MAG: hypothetical protein V2A78_12705 [bacterium]